MSAVTQGDVAAVRTAFEKLHAASRRDPCPSADDRLDRLERLERMLVKARDAIVNAVDEDFGGRSPHETTLVEVALVLIPVRDAMNHLREWMRPKPVAPFPLFTPSSSYVQYLPKGVVGIISPWNYPLNLALSPLSAALAAGNRALLKPSELTPRTSSLLGELIRETFTAEEVAVVEGGAEVASAVTRLPLDHLIYTGSTAVGRLVAAAAAENLVPVTLELGGKSPALVHPDYPIAAAADRIAVGKLFNGGQTCIAPDYALVKEGREREFADVFTSTVRRTYPTLGTNTQYTAIINDRHFARLQGLLDDAREKGARLEVVAPHGEAPKGSRRMAPVLVFGATDSMRVMQEEIFGPILPVQTFRDFDAAIDAINGRPRPLAFYYFDADARRVSRTLEQVISGGATVNDTLYHFPCENLPFGGIGQSGMGAYHGETGFRTFSHARGVLEVSPLARGRAVLTPPYGALLDAGINFLISKLGRWL